MPGQFEVQGYRDPVDVLSKTECQQLLLVVRDGSFPPPLDWHKGHAVTSRAVYDVAVNPAILDVVESVLGRNVVLWGATILQRPPGAIHPWHSDMESCAEGVQGVSVWVGLEHTSAESSLQFISRSHRLGPMLQDARQERNIGREETTTEHVLRWARGLDAGCEFVKPVMTNGQALFFDGRLWHYSENRSPQTRVALLLQYAAASSPVRVPDFSYLDRPFRDFTRPQPPCLVVRGDAQSGVNRIVQAPPVTTPGCGISLRSTRIHELSVPLATNPNTGFRPYHLFRGQTPDVLQFECHASSLAPKNCPHPPHQHAEEELLIVLDGEVQVVLPNLPATAMSESAGNVTHPHLAGFEGAHRLTLRRGEFVYYPVQFTHTVINVGDRPANYLMFKWVTGSTLTASPLSFQHWDAFEAHDNVEPSRQFAPAILFETPTAYLRKLHCHISNIAPGAGHALHHDSYDVAIVMLEGEVENAGARVGANTVIFWPAGEAHRLVNCGDGPARYIVFEFHGSQRAIVGQGASFPSAVVEPPSQQPAQVHAPAMSAVPPPSFLKKLRDPQRWKRKIKHWSQRFRG